MARRPLLLTKADVRSLPALYSQEDTDDPIAKVKLFTPDSSWTWYLTEYDPKQDLAFGLVAGLETELGYIPIDQLRQLRGPLGCKVERDRWFSPKPLSECREMHP